MSIDIHHSALESNFTEPTHIPYNYNKIEFTSVTPRERTCSPQLLRSTTSLLIMYKIYILPKRVKCLFVYVSKKIPQVSRHSSLDITVRGWIFWWTLNYEVGRSFIETIEGGFRYLIFVLTLCINHSLEGSSRFL